MPLTMFASLRAEASGSITRAKSAGDKGKPCLVPLPIVKGGESAPPSLTRAIGHLYRISIHQQNSTPNRDSQIFSGDHVVHELISVYLQVRALLRILLLYHQMAIELLEDTEDRRLLWKFALYVMMSEVTGLCIVHFLCL